MNTRRLLPLLALLPALLSAAEVKLTPDGLAVSAGPALGALTLDYPRLTGSGGGERRAPEKVALSGSTATLSYPGGARLALTLSPDGAAQIHATDLGADDKGISLSLTMPTALAGKARWSIKDSAARPLPYRTSSISVGLTR